MGGTGSRGFTLAPAATDSYFGFMMRESSFGSRHRLAGLFAAVALLTATRGAAQTPTERAARATVDTFFAVVSREKWDSAAAMLDLARFTTYFKNVVGNARSAIPQRPPTVEDLMANDSTLPRAVAQWQIDQMRKGGEAFNYLSTEFAGITTNRELFALTVPAAAARWLEAQDGRAMMRTAWRQQGCSLSDLPDFPAAKRTVLAVAFADDSTAYVVHTDDRFGEAQESLAFGERVMRLHRVGGRWRIEPRRDLLRPDNMGFSIEFDCPKPKKP